MAVVIKKGGAVGQAKKGKIVLKKVVRRTDSTVVSNPELFCGCCGLMAYRTYMKEGQNCIGMCGGTYERMDPEEARKRRKVFDALYAEAVEKMLPLPGIGEERDASRLPWVKGNGK